MFLKIKNYIAENTGILIRLDDIAENMNWDLMERSERLFDKYKIKPVLGVIPNNEDKELLTFPKKDNFWEQIRIWKDKGWEISMHGSNHVYDMNTNKKDYFSHGGKSEFFGHSLEKQISKIEIGLKKFNEENIKIRSFFAPNHTYDDNTFLALKNSGINEIIDGYGLMPYTENNIKFIPQLLYKIVALPFGIQSTQIHLNEWKQKDFDNFEKFITKNLNKIISYNQAIEKINNNFLYKLLNIFTKKILQSKRILKNKKLLIF
jgi:predicted deacetylase